MSDIVNVDPNSVENDELMPIERGLSIIDDNSIGLNSKYENTDFNDTDNSFDLTQNNNDVLSQYVKSISNFPILTKEEEENLFNLYIDKGDQRAGQAIVLSHLRLVVKIAMQYKNFGLNVMDVIAEGNVGLMIALKKFDRAKNARFSTYAC